MDDENQRDLSEKDFEEKFQSQFRELAKQTGVCPDIERLLEFQSGKLSAEDAARIKGHIQVCGLCDWRLENMASFDQIAETAEVSLSPSEWEAVDQRLTARFEDFLKGAQKRENVSLSARIKTALTWFFSKPAIAYVLVLALLYPAYLGIFQKPRVVKEVVKEKEVVQVARPVLDIETPPSFELERVRAPVQGKGEETEIKLGSQEKFFILSFFLPLRPNLRYDAEVVDSHGNRIVEKKDIKSYDGLGNFSLVCGRQLFSGGSYELKVKSVDRQTNQVSEQFPPFRFKM